MNIQLYHGDNLAALRTLPDNSVDAVVTDPPYGLGKQPDAIAMLADWVEAGHHEVGGSGFMGKKWDAFVPQPVLWREVYRVLKPGGHVLAFAGTRTQDLMALGLRLAGFEIRDLVGWLYGSGFPKSHDIGKAIDNSDYHKAGSQGGKRGRDKTNGVFQYRDKERASITASATDAARQWEGWGTALKPAFEPITMARKPLEGTVVANVLKWHTGGLNIGGCRVGAEDGYTENAVTQGINTAQTSYEPRQERRTFEPSPQGRWPANIILDGSDEVVGLFPDSKGQHSSIKDHGNFRRSPNGVFNMMPPATDHAKRTDTGSAARFFYHAKASKRDRNSGLPAGELNKHPTVKPQALCRYLCRLVTPPGGTVLDPYMGSGTTGVAAIAEGFAFIGMEMEQASFDTAHTRIHGERARIEMEDLL